MCNGKQELEVDKRLAVISTTKYKWVNSLQFVTKSR